MIKTDPTMLVCDATPGPWQSVVGATNGGGRLIIESHDFNPAYLAKSDDRFQYT